MVQFECPRHWKTSATLRLGEIHFPIFSLPLSGVIRIGPQYKSEKVGKFGEQNWLNRLQMVQFECPRHWKTGVSLRLGDFHFPIFSLPLSWVIRIGPQHENEKVWKFEKRNWLNLLQMVQFECPRHWKTRVSLTLGDFHFYIPFPYSALGRAPWVFEVLRRTILVA